MINSFSTHGEFFNVLDQQSRIGLKSAHFPSFLQQNLQNVTNTWKKEISTNAWSKQHPNAGQNNQQQFVNTKILPNRF